jgi:hypothetical protein
LKTILKLKVMKNLPIGIQSFEKLRSEDFLYVDKTKEIHQLTNSSIVFLSRPRRFGKSLLVSTLDELYKGNQSLFEGLYIYDKLDWTQQYPVIRIDWTNIEHGSREEIICERCSPVFPTRYSRKTIRQKMLTKRVRCGRWDAG